MRACGVHKWIRRDYDDAAGIQYAGPAGHCSIGSTKASPSQEEQALAAANRVVRSLSSDGWSCLCCSCLVAVVKLLIAECCFVFLADASSNAPSISSFPYLMDKQREQNSTGRYIGMICCGEE